MIWRSAKSLAVLKDQLNFAYPNRNKESDGTIGDAAHAATVSQHNPNAAGVVTAFDITTDPQIKPADLAEKLCLDSRTWYVIYNRRIRYFGGSWQKYSGSDPHTSHIHISTVQNQAAYDNENKWDIGASEMPTTPTVTTLRIIETEVRGSDLTFIHSGQFDKQMIDAHGFKDVNAYIYESWQAGGEFRQNREIWRRFYQDNKNLKLQYDELVKQIGELSERPTQANFDALKKMCEDVKLENSKLKTEQEESIKTGNRFMQWLGGLFRSNS